MTRTDILDRIRDNMVELFELDRALITPAARLVEDLDLDSIDAIDLIAKLQDLTGTRLEEKDLHRIRTVADIVEVVDKLINPESASAS